MFWQLIRLISLNIKFLFIEPRFRYCFFSHSITGLCFASCYRVRDKYASWDFHPRFMTCPSYKKDWHLLQCQSILNFFNILDLSPSLYLLINKYFRGFLATILFCLATNWRQKHIFCIYVNLYNFL